jgi:hypothetical protein
MDRYRLAREAARRPDLTIQHATLDRDRSLAEKSGATYEAGAQAKCRFVRSGGQVVRLKRLSQWGEPRTSCTAPRLRIWVRPGPNLLLGR